MMVVAAKRPFESDGGRCFAVGGVGDVIGSVGRSSSSSTTHGDFFFSPLSSEFRRNDGSSSNSIGSGLYDHSQDSDTAVPAQKKARLMTEYRETASRVRRQDSSLESDDTDDSNTSISPHRRHLLRTESGHRVLNRNRSSFSISSTLTEVSNNNNEIPTTTNSRNSGQLGRSASSSPPTDECMVVIEQDRAYTRSLLPSPTQLQQQHLHEQAFPSHLESLTHCVQSWSLTNTRAPRRGNVYSTPSSLSQQLQQQQQHAYPHPENQRLQPSYINDLHNRMELDHNTATPTQAQQRQEQHPCGSTTKRNGDISFTLSTSTSALPSASAFHNWNHAQQHHSYTMHPTVTEEILFDF